MDQRSLDFTNNQSHEIYLQLDKAQQQSVVELMTLLITAVFQAQEKAHHDQSQHAKQNQG